MKQNRILSLLGLATRAAAVVSGEFMTEKAVRSGKAQLVIVGCDASENTRKNFRDMCAHYHVPCFEYATKEELGHAMGKEFRASLAILDEGFAKEITKQMKTEDNTVA